MPIKTLMLVPNMRVSSGVASYAMNYFRALDHSKVKMDFALFSDAGSPYYKEILRDGSKIYVLPGIKRPISHLRECARVLREGDYDILHDNTLIVSLPLMIMAAAKHVPARILHSHSAKLGEKKQNEIRNKLFMPLLKSTATHFAACSDKAAANMFGKRPYHFIPNIIKEQNVIYSEEDRAELRKEMGSENKIVIGTVGRISPPKNPLFALEVIKEACRLEPSVEYWWIGTGSMDEAFIKRAEELGISDHLRMMGNREDVFRLYQAMDVFFLPSLFEGMPLTGIEAQAEGLPLVVSDVVTKDLVFTDLVVYMSLRKTATEWAKMLIDKAKENSERHIRTEELRNSPFSEKNATDDLTHYYMELCGIQK